ncbi:DUF6318 family protein [Isoptericola sp. NPDC058082]|uniref:DUF6318 family protein n=1 Tax=Isoptericola sp. NPDC058082 TaxID=3346331 RepID=UPI0036E3EC43
MTRSRAILAATSIAAAAVLLVAGCDDDPPATPSAEPTATDVSPSASPSPSSSAVVVAPERPQEMDDDGPAGAEAAAVYFLELDDYIMKTGDTAEWEAMSHKSCEYCTNRLEQSKLIAERGDTFEGGEARIRILQTYEQDATTGIWPIDVEIKESRSTITDAKGSVVFEQNAQTSTARVETTRSEGHWVIVGVPDIPES